MIECGSLEYAQARIGARHGERLREADWHRIEVLRELRPLLEFARSTALRPWLAGIDADSSVHRLEAALRDRWRTVVGEVASWMPARWRPALAWWSVLPDLAPLQHLARDEEPAAWMRDDDAWRELCASAPEARAARLAGGPLAALAAAWPAPETLAQVWQAEWRRRWPEQRRDTGDMLEHLASVLLEHERRFSVATSGQGWLQRTSLRARLALLLRRATLDPAAAFIHLMLCALDLERLRAELVRRILFVRWTAA